MSRGKSVVLSQCTLPCALLADLPGSAANTCWLTSTEIVENMAEIKEMATWCAIAAKEGETDL